MLQVARVNLGISQSELERRQALLDAGRLPGLDIHEARAQVAQDELSVTNAVNDSIIARLDLAQLLNLPDAEGFDIAPLGDDERLLPSPDDVFANALQYNHTMRAGTPARRGCREKCSPRQDGLYTHTVVQRGLRY